MQVRFNCRLSKDDDTDGTSLSIESQRQILSDFCKEHNLTSLIFTVMTGLRELISTDLISSV